VIGTFYFDEAPSQSHVVVTLFKAKGNSFGDVTLSAAFADQLLQAGLSDATVLPIASALAYGVFLAASLAVPLTLTGDRFAWDPTWGTLQPRRSRPHRAPDDPPPSPRGDSGVFPVGGRLG
jgi:hypothetical protein